MKYTSYKSKIDEIRRSVSRHVGTTKSERTKLSAASALSSYIKNDPKFPVSLIGRMATIEWNWIKSDRLMLFVANKEVFQSIYRGRYDINDIHAVKPFSSELILNFPRDMVIDGFKLHSLMVGFSTSNKFVEDRIDPMLHDLGIPDVEDYVVADGSSELIVESFYRAFDVEAGKWATYRMYATWSSLGKILESGDVNVLRGTDGNPLDDEVDTSEEEDRLQYIFLRFIVSLLVYAQASEGKCFKDGLPGEYLPKRDIDFAFRSKPIRAVSIQSLSQGESNRNGSVPHYRAWHIRQLRDERYYQNEHAGKPFGSRLVFVKDSVVNRDVTAKTVVDRNHD